MDILNLLRELKQRISEKQNCEEYRSILAIVDKAIEDRMKNRFCSITDATRIFLEKSSDYRADLYNAICEVDTAISTEYTELLKKFMTDNSSLSEKRIEKCIKELKIHRDLYKELIEYILNGNRYICSDLIEVQGYSVIRLMERYPLTIVGAYNYMIYLREDPVNALADLDKGLPRR